MVNLLKNNSTQGLYFVEEENGQILNDTPGEIDLDNLSLNDTYIYFETILRFEEKLTFNKEGKDWTGFWTWQDGNNGARAGTGGGMKSFYLITVETDETTAENLKRLASLNVVPTDGLKYLVKQTAASAFEKFPNESSVLKNASGIIIRGVDIVEIAESGKDVKVINIACERVTGRG